MLGLQTRQRARRNVVLQQRSDLHGVLDGSRLVRLQATIIAELFRGGEDMCDARKTRFHDEVGGGWERVGFIHDEIED